MKVQLLPKEWCMTSSEPEDLTFPSGNQSNNDEEGSKRSH